MHERVRAELIYRGQRAAAAASSRLDTASLHAPYASEGQLAALGRLLDGAVKGEVQQRHALASSSPGALPEKARQQLQAVLALERAAQVVEHLLGQRRDPLHGQRLQWADACAQVAWQGLLERLPAGLQRPPAPPLVWLEPSPSPATLVRDKQVATPLLARGPGKHTLTLPVVLLPPDQLAAPWHWPALYHELGHDLDHEYGLEPCLAAALRQELPRAGLPPRRVEAWAGCARELVADAIGLVIGGEGLAWSLSLVLHGGFLNQAAFGVYPPPLVRLELAAALLELLGAGSAELLAHLRGIADGAAVGPTLRACLAGPRGDVGTVARVLLDSSIEALGGRTLATLGDPAGEGSRIRDLATWLAEGCVPPAAALHLLPSAAARAACRPGADLAALAERFERHLRQAELPEWVVPSEQWELYNERVRRWLPTIVDDPADPYKRPPVELMAASQRIAFVGGTQHQLAGALQRAFELRGERKWALLEVYLVEGEALAAMAFGETTAADLERRRAQSLADLLPLLGDLAEEWAVYSHAQPFLFASYWDWEQPGGRIHVSPQIWGLDIGRCPALDYTWPAGPEPVEYAKYRQGLDELRRRARRVDGG